LVKVRSLHATRVQNAISSHIVESITRFESTLSAKSQAQEARRAAVSVEDSVVTDAAHMMSGYINVKCMGPDGDNRKMSVPRGISFIDLNTQVSLKFGCQVMIQFEDESKDKITIDSFEMLNSALRLFDASRAPELKIFVLYVGQKHVINSSFAPSKGHAIKFTKEQLTIMKNLFQSEADEKGELDEFHFMIVMDKMNITDTLYKKRLFDAFDTSKDGQAKNGKIDCREFIAGMSIMWKGSVDERLRMCFDAYDDDRNGTLDRSEFIRLFKACTRQTQRSHQTRDQAAIACFNKADANYDGSLSFDEFKQACCTDPIMLEAMTMWMSGVNLA